MSIFLGVAGYQSTVKGILANITKEKTSLWKSTERPSMLRGSRKSYS